jgi:hypothetical protein
MAATKSLVYDPDLKPSRILRRYLDLPKYLDLLRSSALYFRRADKFTDRFEGALTPAIRKSMDEAYRNDVTKYNAEEFYRRCRLSSYVSCWSLGAEDNMALWQLYGGTSNSVAITTTVARIVAAGLKWNESVRIHKVRYIDHFQNPDMVLGWHTDILKFKHNAYEFENEVRILVPRSPDSCQDNPTAIQLPVRDLNGLIRSVVVGPEAEPWFFDLVEDVTRRYNITSPVRRSTLTYLPK